MTPVEQITSLYIGYFGRAPDPVGLNYWVGRLNDGFSLAEIAESFSVQPEAQARYPYLANQNIASPQAFIAQIYLNLFNRTPDAEGLAYWTAQLNSGRDVGDFILDVISGAVTNPDRAIIENKIEVGADFALDAANSAGFVYDDAAAAAAAEVINGVDETEASVAEGKAETDAFIATGNVPGGGVVGRTFTLTDELDQLVGTGNDDTFQGVAENLGVFDSINGGAGNDTLNILGDLGDADFTGVSIQSVETINITGNASDVDATVFGNANAIWQIGTAGDVGNIAANQTVGFRGIAAGATQNVVLGFTGAAANIALAGEGNLEFTIEDQDTGEGDVDLTTLNISGSANGVLELGSTAGAPDLETVNLALTSDTSISVGSSSDDSEDEFAGFSNVTTIDASASTGDLSIGLPGELDLELEQLTLGSGSDEVAVDIGAFAADSVSINLGSGADELLLGGESDEDGVAIQVTLGAGADVVRIQTANVADVEDLEASLITITDFGNGADLLDVGLPLLAFTPGNAVTAALEDLDAGATLADAVEAVVDSADFTGAAIIDFGGNTYVYFDVNEDEALSSGDMLVQFTGGVDFDSNNFVNNFFAA
jgi:hypothetical protein